MKRFLGQLAELGHSGLAIWLGVWVAIIFWQVATSPLGYTIVYEPNKVIAWTEAVFGLLIAIWGIERLVRDFQRFRRWRAGKRRR